MKLSLKNSVSESQKLLKASYFTTLILHATRGRYAGKMSQVIFAKETPARIFLTLPGKPEAFLRLRSMASAEQMLDKYLLIIRRNRPGEDVEEKSRELGSECSPCCQEALR